MDSTVFERQPLLAPDPQSISATKIWPLIFNIKKDICRSLDTALSWDQLNASDVNFTVVRPILVKYASLRNLGTVFAFLVVRAHFISSAEGDLAHAHIKMSQASLCELLAIKMLRHFAKNQIELVAVLTVNWHPIAGAPPEVKDAVKKLVGGREDDLDDPASAIEVAIATESKYFLATPLAQTVINDIYTGRVVYTIASTRSLIADNYKQRQIEIYDPKRAPFLDHYRLRVPKYGQILEFLNFTVLLLAFLLCLSSKRYDRINVYELIFMVFSLSFALGEYAASKEHGWQIYMANMWNGFDTAFIAIFLTYFGLRMKGLLSQDDWFSALAFDIMACGACILFPRLAFFAISNNVVILALRGMVVEFIFFILIAAICFSGLLFTLWDLAGGTWTVKNTAWLMIQIWFGNTWLSFNQASSFHPVFGPPLMVIYAAMSNTLLITILISILSNTFARIDQHATQEYLFQFAISTIEGVKSDALFSYQPPFNILAFLLLGPLSLFASPRTLHSVNVFLIRLTSFPILIIISIYEKYLAPGRKFVERSKLRAAALFNSLPRNIRDVPLIEALIGANGTDLLDAIFDVDVDEGHLEPLFAEDDYLDRAHILTQQSIQSDPARSKPASVINVGKELPTAPAQQNPDALRVPPPLPSPRVPRSPGVASGSGGASVAPSGEAGQNRLQKRSQTPATRPMSTGPILMTYEGEPTNYQSPLARLFSSAARRPPRPIDYAPSQVPVEEALIGIKRLEGMIEGLKEDKGAVAKVRSDMKELQERQARIETLLMTLTRGMRGESSGSKSPNL
ncbi:hypothetical protein M408DRAFT_326068 [Serendipita vermifera MAFF 305830]|uniref:Polycystin cation channel PKD1/PKD2 domain-containing protein n=1 Tax=Serendipita vermifera MAFF 305830 TaxID=933852 RepID=A0A0C2XWP8_SERVB|nr:hypothetical protein M408DRAFT_326068 [Serendipita vermifera MAFF 305830]